MALTSYENDRHEVRRLVIRCVTTGQFFSGIIQSHGEVRTSWDPEIDKALYWDCAEYNTREKDITPLFQYLRMRSISPEVVEIYRHRDGSWYSTAEATTSKDPKDWLRKDVLAFLGSKSACASGISKVRESECSSLDGYWRTWDSYEDMMWLLCVLHGNEVAYDCANRRIPNVSDQCPEVLRFVVPNPLILPS